MNGGIPILLPAEIDRLLLPYLGTLAGLALAIACFHHEVRRRHPAKPAPPSRAGDAVGREAGLAVALALLLLGWLLRYAADRFGGGWALAGHAVALAGIGMLARVMIRRMAEPPQPGEG